MELSAHYLRLRFPALRINECLCFNWKWNRPNCKSLSCHLSRVHRAQEGKPRSETRPRPAPRARAHARWKGALLTHPHTDWHLGSRSLPTTPSQGLSAEAAKGHAPWVLQASKPGGREDRQGLRPALSLTCWGVGSWLAPCWGL